MINIDALIENARKTSDKEALRAFQNLKAKIQIAKTSKNGKSYNDAEEIHLISNYVKSLNEDIKTFSEAHREDLIAEYTSELEVLKKLLPEPVTEAQICSFVFDYGVQNNMYNSISDVIEIPKKEMGKVIKAVKEKYPQADGKLVSTIVKVYVI